MANLVGRRWKFWPIPLAKWSNRRLFGRQFICRLPLLALWTLIVIVLLYKSLSDSSLTDVDKANKVQETFLDHLKLNQNEELVITPGQDQLNGRQQQYISNRPDNDITKTKAINNKPVITNSPYNFHGPTISTTKKSTIEDYSRGSKVFILIIQNEDHYPNQILKKAPSYRDSGEISSPLTLNSHTSTSSSSRPFIPAHLRLLIDILNSHRIEYTVDTTRTGLPTSLLIDQDNSSETKQYSVIVIDDFIKYTKLNRWIRDQLDRHCRSNQIGVVAYLTGVSSDVKHHHYHHPHQVQNGFRYVRSESDFTSTEESLANQFPLSFRSIDQTSKSCNNLSSNTCLVDYQLNDRSPILRILKRRQNFILEGPLIPNLNQSPWVAMSSNHITYEPLTWAKFRRSPENLYDYSSSKGTFSETFKKLDNTQKINSGKMNSPSSSDKSHNSELGMNNTVVSNEDSAFSASSLKENDDDDDIERQVLSMFDRGLYDGIKRVIFGGANHHWLNRIILLDAIEHLSAGKILGPLERYIQIDIDDIFVGERGTRMNASDVDALIETQRQFGERIDGGFKFNLGYSGKYFKRGFEQENLGDERLIMRAREFTWFCHTWSHSKAHLLNDIHSIEMELKKNLEFGRQHKLPLIGHDNARHTDHSSDSEPSEMPPTYAIAPHHSGVYPIHELLYDAWRKVLNVQVTSTEEYPRLRPANGRRAFVHKTIKVLPRQTCGLYTHTIYRHKYPGGFEKLEASIRGGELFETILHNPVNIYMTHMSNYANDRLAPYTFGALLDFVQTNTNLQLKYATSDKNQLGPMKLAQHYFQLYPEEQQPLWTNPCSDKRHLAIWAPSKHQYCSMMPKLLIVGPQKTGTTALYTFLKMNNLFRSSELFAGGDFEEIQFFNDKHYFKGVDWYLSRFRSPKTDGARSGDKPNAAGSYYFDKSATYFDDPKAPRRASYLIPEARIVLLLVNPADRAYSWYQHIKAHGDLVANSMSFEQIIMEQEHYLTTSTKTTMTSSSGSRSGSTNNNNGQEAFPTTTATAITPTNTTATFTGPSNSTLNSIRSLRNRCLHPGYYAQHLIKWLDYYPSRQIIIIDGQWFRYNPASVMNRLQLLLRVERPLDYSKMLIYDQQKGFYCQRSATGNGELSSSSGGQQKRSNNAAAATVKCLGESKGRKYEPMSQVARVYLNRHYWPHNRQLARILSDIGQPLPIWLDEAMNSVAVGSRRVSSALMY